MDGVHDMGGMHGFGRVEPEENEPVFHADWEKTVYGISRALRLQDIVNIDESRHAIERIPPAQYLASSYYERWLAAHERLAVEKGIVTPEELERRIALLERQPDASLPTRTDPALAALVHSQPSGRAAYEREGPAPRFDVGDKVRTRTTHPTGHTRLPRYARDKVGTIHAVHGVYVFPDTNAHGQGEQPQPMYSVRFDAAELWGDAADGRGCVYIVLWEPYLQPDETGSKT